MKLLVLARLYVPHRGGVEKHIRGRNKILLKKGFSITTVTSRHKKNLKEVDSAGSEKIRRIDYPEIKFVGLVYIWYWLLKNNHLIKEADIIQIQDVFTWYLPFRFLYPTKRVFTTFHGWEGIYPVPKKNILFRKLAAKFSTDYICGGKYIEKYYGIKVKKVILTPLDVPKKINTKKDLKRVVYVGRLDEDTGLLNILEGLKKLAGFEIDFCGDGPLKNECKKYGKVHGFVDPKPFYEKSFFSIGAGYNSIMESLAYKNLVITTYNNPLKRDYLKMTPFAKWIIVKKSGKEMIEAIEYYSKNPNEVNMMLDSGRKWIETQTWDKFTQEYLNLWKIK